MNRSEDILKIDVDSVLRSRVPRYYRFMPRWFVRWIERTICQDELNALLESNRGRRDSAFCRGVLRDLDVGYSVIGSENLPPVDDRMVTFVCNHPLGALDGIAIIDFVSRRYGMEVKFIVNDLLMAIEPLRGTFVPVNKHGRQSRGGADAVTEAFAGNRPVIVFPAGVCSRRGDDGTVADLAWNKMFVNKSAEFGRKVIPLRFDGHNSNFFYNFARLRKRLGIKFNIEMIRLPKEVFLCRGRRFTIHVGMPIPAGELRTGPEAMRQAAEIRRKVYNLE